MRVITSPGCYNEEEKQMSAVMLVYDFGTAFKAGQFAEQNAAIIKMRAEQNSELVKMFGVPHRREVE